MAVSFTMAKTHRYTLHMEWTGNEGTGTSGYRAYGRQHRLSAPGKSDIFGSADPAFRGDAAAWNPEEMLVASISACHQLWYLHLAADAGIIVTDYRDDPVGELPEDENGSGAFALVTLHPRIRLANPHRADEAQALHHRAHEMCFIARSVNFPVLCEPVVETD